MGKGAGTPASKQPLPKLEKLTATLRTYLPRLRECWGVCSLGVFGSYIRGEQRPGSDLDLLVEFDGRPLSLLRFVELEQHLGDLLGVKVDLVEPSTLKPAIGRRILEEVRAL